MGIVEEILVWNARGESPRPVSIGSLSLADSSLSRLTG